MEEVSDLITKPLFMDYSFYSIVNHSKGIRILDDKGMEVAGTPSVISMKQQNEGLELIDCR